MKDTEVNKLITAFAYVAFHMQNSNLANASLAQQSSAFVTIFLDRFPKTEIKYNTHSSHQSFTEIEFEGCRYVYPIGISALNDPLKLTPSNAQEHLTDNEMAQELDKILEIINGRMTITMSKWQTPENGDGILQTFLELQLQYDNCQIDQYLNFLKDSLSILGNHAKTQSEADTLNTLSAILSKDNICNGKVKVENKDIIYASGNMYYPVEIQDCQTGHKAIVNMDSIEKSILGRHIYFMPSLRDSFREMDIFSLLHSDHSPIYGKIPLYKTINATEIIYSQGYQVNKENLTLIPISSFMVDTLLEYQSCKSIVDLVDHSLRSPHRHKIFDYIFSKTDSLGFKKSQELATGMFNCNISSNSLIEKSTPELLKKIQESYVFNELLALELNKLLDVIRDQEDLIVPKEKYIEQISALTL